MSIVNIEALKQLGAVLYWPGQYASSGAYSETGDKRGFVILPAGVTITPTGTFTSVKGKDGRNYYYFNSATPNYIYTTAHANLAFGAYDFTICYWVKHDSIATQQYHIDFRPASTSGYYFTVYMSATGYLTLYSNSTTLLTQTTPFVASTWCHIAIVRRSGTIYIYRNGVLDGSVANAYTYLCGTSRPVIGSNGYTIANLPLLGSMKDLMICYGKGLTYDQINAIIDETFIY